LEASIGRLSDAARRITSGEFVSEITVHSRDELGGLARQMEEMSSRIQRHLGLLESERNHLTTVLNSMTEGVLVTDDRGRITISNPAFLTIFGLESDPSGRLPLEVIRNMAVRDGIERVLEDRRFHETEVRISEKVLIARFAALKVQQSVEGVVVVFHDISELRRLERLQREFTSNVSHELKTPLTSIQGYAETLLEEEGLQAVHRGFVERVYRNAAHLSEMIEELLSLARLETGQPWLTMDQIYFSVLMEELRADYSEELEKKGLRFEVSSSAGQDWFYASRQYIRSVFRNLIENSIKYTQEGSIEVEMLQSEGSYRFCVRDSGIGIPKQDLDRVFERFYRVDKDRSRSSGGSGVGLAIVKHIVELHNGRVWAESALDEGTAVYFSFPRYRPGVERSRDEQGYPDH
jgi:two-component system phosphate regulon sensor histidine kinase PhoR